MSILERIFNSFGSSGVESKISGNPKEEPLKVRTIGTDYFVVDIDSLFDSETVKAQARAASKVGRNV
ncbi:hypothetical protein [Pseudoalteromonas sp. S16_S37]|uniref:hypothetical protein n=1 Tax=Pseudoalteromonas sp. S16_S37 TaxID=2720228 RepID=UPI001680B8FC|nr:hypothetical protein [Pseudoalteromonas sp. S16_S37]MBD1583483.1 hypothetical protein [Pseudoalteromonas sp. S16_S37]